MTLAMCGQCAFSESPSLIYTNFSLESTLRDFVLSCKINGIGGEYILSYFKSTENGGLLCTRPQRFPGICYVESFRHGGSS